uniref:Ubiquitin-like domain-containing protein n=1 Tax=Ascaris lumbricoides TaxID=6252 RepID=A0A0M3HPT9_ASCLU
MSSKPPASALLSHPPPGILYGCQQEVPRLSTNEQGETLTIDIAPNDDVRALWMEIQAELKDRDLNKAKLVFNGVELQENKALQEYQIEESSVIHLKG